MNPLDQFSGANAGYVYELFERYQRDPSSVDEATRRAFATWTPAEPVAPQAPEAPQAPLAAGIAAFNLAESIRRFPDQQTLLGMMREAGFEDCRHHNLSGGIVALHKGFRY